MKTITLFVLALGLCVIGHGQTDTKPVLLKDVLGSNNTFKDPVMSVSLTYPAGWQVISGFRWPSEASPSMYYQGFRPDSPRPADVNAWLLEAARKKEASRQGAGNDYRNDPATLMLRNFGDRRGMSYVATFTSGGRPMAEYNVRVVGEKAYVMFFTFGPLEDVLNVRREIDQMAETVSVP